jgi:transforming growth factor-beta-induced protein
VPFERDWNSKIPGPKGIHFRLSAVVPFMRTIVSSLVTLLALAVAALITTTVAAKNSPAPGTWRGQSVTEFDPAENEKFQWEIVNDGVMGGLSKGTVKLTNDGTMKFSGELSLKNNGGFSTVRSRDVQFDLSNDEGLLFLVKGDGRTYQARLASDERYRSMEVSFTGEFKTTKGEWQQVKIPFSEFKGSFRGIDLEDKVLDPSKIKRVGILLGDKKEGPFDLEIDWIRTYGKGRGELASTGKGPSSLVETVLADGRFKTLASALTKAELVEALEGEGPLTVFAPTDEAFAKVPAKLLKELLLPKNKAKLASILTYHVSPGASALGDALKLKKVPTIQGATIGVAFSDGSIRINEAALIDSDLQCSNGIIHVIDSVLLPPKAEEPKRQTVLSVAEQAGTFATLVAAIGAAELDATLEGEGPFTVFAPTEEAFAALPKGTVASLLKKENRQDLAALLTYHVVPGRVSAGDALNAGEAKTVQGENLKFRVSEGLLKVNDSTIRTVDLDGGNGVIHVIDTVLLPPSTTTKEQANVKTAPADAMTNASELIVAAIEKGVPLYNGGDAKGCAAVYRECIVKLASNDQIDGHTRSMLGQVVDAGSKRPSDEDRAWFYRNTLDRIMNFLH